MKRFTNAALLLAILLGFSRSGSALEIRRPETEGELFALIDTLKTKSLPQLRTIERCVREANAFVLDYQEIKKTYSLASPSDKTLAVDAAIIPNSRDFDLNLVRNFKRISEQNSAFFAELRRFMDGEDRAAQGADLSGIERSIQSFQMRSSELSQRLYPLAAKESQFLYLLGSSRDIIQNHIDGHRVILRALIGKECENASVAWQIIALEADARTLSQSISEMRDYVLAVKRKRDAVVDRLLTSYRRDLERIWRKEFVRQGRETLQSVEGTLALVRLGSAFEEYWIGATMNGLADSKHQKYLQYEEPLRNLTVELARLKTFEADFRRIPQAPTDLMLAYANKALNHQKLVQDSVDKLLAAGWQGQLKRQILLNERRQQMADRYSSECNEMIERHLSKAKAVETLTQFRASESLYKALVDLCTL